MYFEGEELISIAIQNLENDFRLEGKIINANLLTYILLNSIIIHIPILICLVTGDAIAGEAASGTLRLILQKPFKRSQIYIAKALTGFFICYFINGFFGVNDLRIRYVVVWLWGFNSS